MATETIVDRYASDAAEMAFQIFTESAVLDAAIDRDPIVAGVSMGFGAVLVGLRLAIASPERGAAVADAIEAAWEEVTGVSAQESHQLSSDVADAILRTARGEGD